MNITLKQLRQTMPGAPLARAGKCLPYINEAMREFEINTRLRTCAFLAQVAHECGDLTYLAEVWGPTAAQKRYDTRTDLGNTAEVDGDGYRFRGRGAIQITGAANYKAAARDLAIDLFDRPDQAMDYHVSFRLAGWYWQLHGCNQLADGLTGSRDRRDLAIYTAITKRINGGTNGLEDRVVRYARALKALPPELPPTPEAPPPAATPPATPQPAATDQQIKEILENQSVRVRALVILKRLGRLVLRPLVIGWSAVEAYPALGVPAVVLIAAVIFILLYLHRKEVHAFVKKVIAWIVPLLPKKP